jgi:NAD(P)H-hydrate epimerase
MRKIDEVTIRDFIPGTELMENAGAGVTEELLAYFKPGKSSAIVVVCGKGNNGGDGFVIARLLKKKGRKVRVFLLGKAREVKGDAAANLKRCEKARIKVNEVDEATLPKLEDQLLKAGVIVDAIFGTGFEGRPRGIYRDVIQFMNDCPAVKVAVDVPSGVDASTGEAELAVDADLTVTMALPKLGHFLYPGKGYTGDLYVHDIGVPPEVVLREDLMTFVLGRADVEEALPVRLPDAHKWSCGHAVAICGSTGFTGAASLTALSAMRAGSGLVTLVTPRSLNSIMEIKLTEVMTFPVDETAMGSLAFKARKDILDFVDGADAVAIGPGLSQNKDTVKLVRHLIPRLGVPTVLDADGINAFAGQARKLKKTGFPLVITPHAGEASRLFGVDKPKIMADPVEFARRAAKDLGLVMVLKGAPTIVAGPEGDVYINPTGNQGLATAGSGDVLTGIIAGLLAQGADALEAAASGVYIHGYLADMLLEEYGYFGFMAGELVETIPEAIADIVWE